MSGHSKWATIKHKKAVIDAKRGKVFTKLIKEITVAARTGGGDPAANPRLRFLLDRAKAVNMPQDNALRAVKKGTGELPGVQYEAHTYEGYGPGNTAVIVEVLTDNKNKAIAELRHTFSRHGGRVAENGAVSWMFKREGLITATCNKTEEELMEALLDFPIETITDMSDPESPSATPTWYITTDPKSLEVVKEYLSHMTGCTVQEALLGWRATTMAAPTDAEGEKAVAFLQALEELDDVQEVYSNLE